MTVEQIRDRMLTKIHERWDELKNEDGDLFEIFVKFTRFKNTIELGLSLGLINMGEYLKWDTEGDHLFHDKKESLKDDTEGE
ncbi:MAG: hypothetical protein IJ419_00390 [Agathobacter sp.]|nr:hypothetical protein [Agathobacter sp.]